ncbi:hypothetical protein RFI_03807 [Reticulomyxa filosa]|uniref:Uncharacterized protein n=1 Tax=Reticulomyxa filosa TaxID=46433 RepID=X6P421_RETFI|nr:hypothetical protein RFI_03807 [Reticulomyxa filosa]|eukprot:ETO33300.1 hypothetical protein RFI_03807 [Reticulomyxa filosa]
MVIPLLLNVFSVVSSANNEFNWEQTNTFGPLRQYKYIYNIKEQELITWRRVQYSQVNGMLIVLLVQISNKEPIPSKSESIRIPRNKLSINPKESNKNPNNKTPSINMFKYMSTISAAFYKLAFKSTLSRSNVKKKMFIKKKKCTFTYIGDNNESIDRHISNLTQNDFKK